MASRPGGAWSNHFLAISCKEEVPIDVQGHVGGFLNSRCSFEGPLSTRRFKVSVRGSLLLVILRELAETFRDECPLLVP